MAFKRIILETDQINYILRLLDEKWRALDTFRGRMVPPDDEDSIEEQHSISVMMACLRGAE